MRALWSGAISFGLIHIPVKLYTAVREKGPDLDMLRRKDLCPIRYARVCRNTGEEVPYEDIVKGYQYRKGDYVVLEDEDFRRANVRKTQTIDMVEFVDAGEIDLKFPEKPYYLEPAKEARKAYALLREALKRTAKVGVGKFVLRNREHLVVLKPEGDLIVLEQMRFLDEIKKPDLDLPAKEEASERELGIAVKLIDQLTEPFRPEDFHDTYREELERVIAEKAEGKGQEEPREAQPLPTEVPDLMAKLRESLEHARKQRTA